MGRKKLSQVLHCSLNSTYVGTLTRKGNQLAFQYSEQYLQNPEAFPISQSLPLVYEPQQGDQVVSYFDNLLPDEQIVRQHVVDRLGANSVKPFDLLQAVGGDCVGALTFSHEIDTRGVPEVDLQYLSEQEVSEQIKQTRLGTLGMSQTNSFRISIAGAQDKTALTRWDGRWGLPKGKTPTTHIFKPSIVSRDERVDMSNSVYNEFFCMSLLQACGFDTANTTVERFENEAVLIVERFDRLIDEKKIYRVAQEDLCQALGVSSGSKYEDKGGPSAKEVVDFLRTSRYPEQDIHDFFASHFLFWLIGAIDGHAKNFSVFIDSEGYTLTPFYDVMSVWPYVGQGEFQAKKIEMAMSVRGSKKYYKWHKIMPRHWLNQSKILKIAEDDALGIINQMLEVVPSALDVAKRKCEKYGDDAIEVAEVIEANTLEAIKRYKRLSR
ncbi:HipA domain-containing protein [Catenovulum adriaticum]|uniref:HipA domain-containing protein n=1 Tax=Catenovulum adriaticum TaxID=2984846 RepID=A0ABY7ALZ8_9ALTE|nr:HipA domain-containing protein [Catenovulum sp. TS8]WAJ69364.1 HipA domain-containing protein [Catenovulum sp. TS8]